MQSAVTLVKSYVPPNPSKIQAVKDAGKVTIDMLEPGKRARINFKDYEKPGDNLGVQPTLSRPYTKPWRNIASSRQQLPWRGNHK